mgnify:CR=1 FL=1
MLGQMMNQPLLISAQIAHAARYHADGEIVSVETTGGLHRTNWGEVERRSRQLGSALLGLGLKQSDRVATLAWNNYRHLEAYFGVSGAGLVCHTINPRLFPEQLVYILNHAQDRVLLIDKTFLPLIAAIKDKLEHLEHVVLLSGEDAEAAEKVPGIKFYDDLVDSGNADFQWPEFDENTASSLCYTSGTTGNPKGALYSHRSTVLHSMAVALPDSLDLSARDCLMPVVPMFHVNAWGIPYAAAMVGSKMVLPGPGLDGDSLKNLINSENVTCAAGVPTLWQGLIGALKKANEKVPSLTRTVWNALLVEPRWGLLGALRFTFSATTILPSLPEMPMALPPACVIQPTSSLLIAPDSTISATLAVSLSVTRSPPMNCDSTPSFLSIAPIWGPPPWTTTTLMPTAFISTTSSAIT